MSLISILILASNPIMFLWSSANNDSWFSLNSTDGETKSNCIVGKPEEHCFSQVSNINQRSLIWWNEKGIGLCSSSWNLTPLESLVKHHKNQHRGTPQNVALGKHCKTAKVLRNKESLRSHHSQELPKKMRWPEARGWPGWDLGITTKTYWVKTKAIQIKCEH